MTIAARVCSAYTDITANKARNDIQESLEDLGPDTPYGAGDLVDPAVEDAVQPNCRPLTGWRFKLGSGYITRAVSGPWGSLSIVSDPFPREIVTHQQTPLLDGDGANTGKKLNGAVTVRLNHEESQLAANPSGLWIQGGVPDDPVLYGPTGGAYGFGAIRCAADDINGDNVEWIGYPAGGSHVFCFAYYVTPPPTAGTIVVRKQTVGEPSGTSEGFPFTGNVSFAPGGDFSLRAGSGQIGEQSFTRAETGPGDEPWRLEELVPDGWSLDDLSCETATGGSGFTYGPGAGSVAISLGSADIATCTYTDRYAPPAGGLVVRKVTRGGTGTFGFEIKPVGGGPGQTTSVRTTREGIPASAPPLELAPGTYRITERSPNAQGRGSWEQTALRCDGVDRPIDEPVEVQVEADDSTVCTFVNRFRPVGSLRVRMVTIGGLARAGYVVGSTVKPLGGALGAATTRSLTPADARGTDLTSVPLDEYDIRQFGPRGPNWHLVAVSCDGRRVPFDEGRVTVRLTTRDPDRRCTFINLRAPAPAPPGPGPTPGPDPPDVTPEPDPVEPTKDEKAELVVTKRAKPHQVVLGKSVRYRVTVTNRGPGTAYDVALSEQQLTADNGAKLVSVKPSKGKCVRAGTGGVTSPTCVIGTMKPGETEEVDVVLIPTHRGRYDNRIVAGTSSPVRDQRRSVATETVQVRRPRVKPPEGPEAPAPCRFAVNSPRRC